MVLDSVKKGVYAGKASKDTSCSTDSTLVPHRAVLSCSFRYARGQSGDGLVPVIHVQIHDSSP